MIENLFIYAVIWSLGSTTDFEGRRRFDAELKLIINKRILLYEFPGEGMTYDWSFDPKSKAYRQWTETIPVYSVDNRLAFNEIAVPTQDSIRIKAITDLLLRNRYNVLSPGPTGTGKSVNCESLLAAMPENFQYISLTFSAQTSANQVQDLIDSKVKRRRNIMYGPPLGTYFVIFVDDLNMPKKEEYGAQPPIELLRQWMDHKGWYNRDSQSKIEIVDIVFLSAMGLPGGGRSHITNRMMRHFNMISYTLLAQSDITLMFTSILNSFLQAFTPEIQDAVPKIVQAVIDVYGTIEKTLLPTPSKSHYTFNLRDMAKVVQGLCSSMPKVMSEYLTLVRLWAHEHHRVFRDRLVSKEDCAWLDELLNQKVEEIFGLSPGNVFENSRLIFNDFMVSGADPRPYGEVGDMKQFTAVVNEYLDSYNSKYTKKQMKLIMFLDACSHVSKVCRILRQPQGNALLLGVGGSGRQSLSRLAAFIMEYEVQQIEVVKGYGMTQWRDDLRACLMYAGVKNEPVVFLFVDTQIISEQMLEEVNNVLNSGDVPNIYRIEDKEDIYAVGQIECQRKNLQPNEMNKFSQYLLRVRKNIHIVLAMSPIGELFRSRLRMFPSLINCCTIDWFHEWPDEALISVAKGQLADEDFNLEDQLESIVEMFKRIHQSVEVKSEKFMAELRRKNYVTPTSYLELLRCFKNLFTMKRKELNTQRTRLQTGLDKLADASRDVAKMKIELKEDKPKLAAANEETERTMENLTRETEIADKMKEEAEVDEAKASAKNDEVSTLTAQADAELREALPAVEKALEALKKLKPEQFVEMKALANPPEAVRTTFTVVCIMFREKPVKKNDPNILGKKIDDYWETSRSVLLKNPKKMFEDLTGYPRDSITQDLINKIEPFINSADFTPDVINTGSQACKPICEWAHAMYKYYHVRLRVKPLQDKVDELNVELAATQKLLAETKEKLERASELIANLKRSYEETIARKQQLQLKISDNEVKIDRSDKLIGGLGGEQTRWEKEVKRLTDKLYLLPGDCVLSAGMVGYVGAFTANYRLEFEQEWREGMKRLEIRFTDEVTMRDTLGDAVKLQLWKVAGLPSDAVSIENGIIIDNARRWPLMIDPQNQANRFIKKLGQEHEEGIESCKAKDSNLMRNLSTSVMNGKWFLIENAGEELDPALEPILTQQVIKEGAGYSIKVGDKTVDYNPNFKLFITTTLPNPHYSPETTVKVTILNFAITPEGLEEQMLGTVVAKESPQLEETKSQLVYESAKMNKQLKSIEDEILRLLSVSKGNILDDETMINTLDVSKKTAEEITVKVQEAKKTEVEIDVARESYRPVAYRASLLFFCIVDLSTVDPMYQYSLQWFTKLFEMGVENSAQAALIEDRLSNLNDYFTYSLYENVCRSLFEKHKLLFSFTLTVKILQGYKQIDSNEWRTLLAGPAGGSNTVPKNPTNWLDTNTWKAMYSQLHGLNSLPNFRGIEDFFLANSDTFKPIFDAVDAHETPLPEPFETKLNQFQKMLVLKAIRPDKVKNAVQAWIAAKLGKQFIESPPLDLSKCYKDSTVTSPLIFVLSPGSDPISAFKRLAEEMNMTKKLESISLGQGMGSRAAHFIEDAKIRGGWVLLQNCHLAESWMPDMEKLVEEFDDSIHRDFRLWLTSMPAKKFPVSVLQNSVKMTIEPPQGLKSNLLSSYTRMDDRALNDCANPEAFKTLLFGFCFFHAIVQDRRKFGPIGWNILYEFTNEDLEVTSNQLKMFLNQGGDRIPYKVLNILGADVNYGGRVTDDKDSRLIKTILETYINPGIFEAEYKFSPSGLYYSPPPGKQSDYLHYISKLPLNPSPEAFGLHENAEITTAQDETRLLLDTILSVQPRASIAGGKSREEILGELAQKLEQSLPQSFDVDNVSLQFPTQYTESMNTVLFQEVIRFQNLLNIMTSSLADVQKALVGRIVMSEELEKMANSLFINQVPAIWSEKGFLSLKPLAAWYDELKQRIVFFNKWIEQGTPNSFWFSGFFFPQAFVTGTLQNYARKYGVAVDRLSFQFSVMEGVNPTEVVERPADGCYVYGMWLEGARWDGPKHSLGESKPKELYTQMPMLHLLPVTDRVPPKGGIYNCPVYKVLSRSGTLSTTGHSTNFVLFIEVPSSVPENVWIKAGVAIFLSLRT
jgi:dynein heavy chain